MNDDGINQLTERKNQNDRSYLVISERETARDTLRCEIQNQMRGRGRGRGREREDAETNSSKRGIFISDGIKRL